MAVNAHIVIYDTCGTVGGHHCLRGMSRLHVQRNLIPLLGRLNGVFLDKVDAQQLHCTMS
jgi:hypothetical protein